MDISKVYLFTWMSSSFTWVHLGIKIIWPDHLDGTFYITLIHLTSPGHQGDVCVSQAIKLFHLCSPWHQVNLRTFTSTLKLFACVGLVIKLIYMFTIPLINLPLVISIHPESYVALFYDMLFESCSLQRLYITSLQDF